jgi:hypothetical protein
VRTLLSDLIRLAADATGDALAEADTRDDRDVYNLVADAMDALDEAANEEAARSREE